MENKFKHVMVDIETLDNKSYAAILSVAAVFFNMETGEIGEKFYMASNIKSNLDAGLNINSDTALWWMKQETALKQWINSDRHDLPYVLDSFAEFLKTQSLGTELDFEIWGNSNRFDMGILANAYDKLEVKKLPWKFRNERDVRTLVSFNPKFKELVIKKAKEEKRNLHDPLVDCEVQIEYCVATYKTLGSCKCEEYDDGLLSS